MREREASVLISIQGMDSVQSQEPSSDGNESMEAAGFILHILGLPPRNRSLLVDHYWGGLTWEGIAGYSKDSAPTLRQAYHRLIDQLRSESQKQNEKCTHDDLTQSDKAFLTGIAPILRHVRRTIVESMQEIVSSCVSNKGVNRVRALCGRLGFLAEVIRAVLKFNDTQAPSYTFRGRNME